MRFQLFKVWQRLQISQSRNECKSLHYLRFVLNISGNPSKVFVLGSLAVARALSLRVETLRLGLGYLMLQKPWVTVLLLRIDTRLQHRPRLWLQQAHR
jgi:hypothetical protein